MGVWDLNFIQRPDAVTGLQRRVGSYFNEFKESLQERIGLEHRYELGDATPQTEHGTHTEGSAKSYVTEYGDPEPTDRPTSSTQSAQLLSDEDRGRLLISEERDLKYYKDSTDGWQLINTTLIGTVVIWPGSVIPTNWVLCDGQNLAKSSHEELYAIIGTTYGGSAGVSCDVPNLQGVLPMGRDTQDVNGRTKGYTDALGTVKEDQIQAFTGAAGMNQVYNEGNIVNFFEGIFKTKTFGAAGKRLDRAGTGSSHTNYGFQIDFNNVSPPLRGGDFGHPSVLLMNYIIRVK